jgi:high-affinity K+ transport system ATPase subunit B
MSEEIAGLYVSINADLTGLLTGLEETRFLLEDLGAEGGLLGSLPQRATADIQKMVAGIGAALAPLPKVLQAGLEKPIAEAMRNVQQTLAQKVAEMIERLYRAAREIHTIALTLGVPSPINVAALEGRAEGGAVVAGKAYWVGEAGPEIFMPGVSGQVIPNGALGGGSSVVIQQLVVQSYAQNGEALLDEVIAAAERRGAERVFAR